MVGVNVFVGCATVGVGVLVGMLVGVGVFVGVGLEPEVIVLESKTVPVCEIASIWSELGETVMRTCSYVDCRKALQDGWLIRN